MNCFHCGIEIDTSVKFRRQDTCAKCGSYLHCCKNCRFYSLTAPKQCKEPMVELVSDKESGNYCSYFEPGASDSNESKRAELARKKLEELFKKPL